MGAAPRYVLLPCRTPIGSSDNTEFPECEIDDSYAIATVISSPKLDARSSISFCAPDGSTNK